jgi:hypothetical protein
MCGDTGLPRYYVKLGNAAVVDGGLAVLECRCPQVWSSGARCRPRSADMTSVSGSCIERVCAGTIAVLVVQAARTEGAGQVLIAC